MHYWSLEYTRSVNLYEVITGHLLGTVVGLNYQQEQAAPQLWHVVHQFQLVAKSWQPQEEYLQAPSNLVAGAVLKSHS